MTMQMIGRKLGMTRVFNEDGSIVPVTVLELGPNVVTQLRTKEQDGFAAVQVGFSDAKPRNSTIPIIGHDAKAGTAPKRVHREFRVDDKAAANFSLGQVLTVKDFEPIAGKFVDVIGTSKGKGFAGTMKRHHFKGMCASHGTERKHRSPGSISGHATNRGWSGKLKKGKKMSGQMGNERVTARSIEVVRFDPDNNLLLVKGPVPGANTGYVLVRPAVRLNRSKTRRATQAKA